MLQKLFRAITVLVILSMMVIPSSKPVLAGSTVLAVQLQGVASNAAVTLTASAAGYEDIVRDFTGGYYVFDSLESNTDYTITPYSDFYTFDPLSQPVNTTFTGAPMSPIYFTATPKQFPLGGVLTSAVDGTPISGATIILETHPQTTVTTGENGVYSFGNFNYGTTYMLSAMVNNHKVRIGGETLLPSQITIDENSGSTNLVAYPILSLSGRVTKPDGSPINGVSLTFDTQDRTLYASTGSDGVYTFMDPVYDDTGTIRPTTFSYTYTPETLTVELMTGNVTGKDFTAASNIYIFSGMVTFNGQPLSGVTLDLNDWQKQTTTNDDGVFSFDVPRTGAVVITPHKDGFTFDPPVYTKEIPEGDRNDVNFSAAIDGVIMSGSVIVNGKPIKDVTITAGIATTKTDNYGRYRMLVQKGVDITPTATHPHYQFDEGAFRTPDAPFTQNWNAASVYVTGYIFEGFMARGEVEVSAGSHKAISDPQSGFYSMMVTSAEVSNITSFTVTPKLANYTFKPASLTITPANGKSDKNFQAVRNTVTVSGKVTAAGRALPGVIVSFGGAQAKTDTYGKYILKLPFGTKDVDLVAFKYGYEISGPAKFDLGTTNVINMNFTATKLLGTCQVTGKALSTDTGLPMVGVAMSLNYKQHLIATVKTNAQGYYAFSNLVCDTGNQYTVIPSKANYQFDNDSVTFFLLDGQMGPGIYVADFNGSWYGALKGVIKGLPAGTKVQLNYYSIVQGSGTIEVTVDGAGNYSYPKLFVDAYILTPVVENYHFTPAHYAVNILPGTLSTSANFSAVHN